MIKISNGRLSLSTIVYIGAITCTTSSFCQPAEPDVKTPKAIATTGEMSPAAIRVWSDIQTFLREGDLRRFDSVVSALSLTVSMPLDEVTLEKPGTRRDIASQLDPIKSGDYSIYLRTSREAEILFRISLDENKVCLSESEIQRVYGLGVYMLGTDPVAEGRSHSAGVRHGLGFPDHAKSLRFGFQIAADGCAEGLSIGETVIVEQR